jgi:hypothetical protein
MREFKEQAGKFGLTIKEVTGDGNCMFRSIADQLFGEEGRHREVRQECWDYIEEQKDYFVHFIEDDETIEEYVEDMRRDHIWGDQLELTALCQAYRFNLIVH